MSDIVVDVQRISKSFGNEKVLKDVSLQLERGKIHGIIGRNGSMLKTIGTDARREMEEMLETRVNLQLFVKVREDWRNKPSVLRELGYE